MHSSRMRSIRCSGRLEGVCLERGYVLGGGVSARGGCLPGGCLPRGGCLLEGVHPPGTESQTGVKTLTFRNYSCGR